jgi:hypothetical protein
MGLETLMGDTANAKSARRAGDDAPSRSGVACVGDLRDPAGVGRAHLAAAHQECGLSTPALIGLGADVLNVTGLV